jgi:hypothetical protein
MQITSLQTTCGITMQGELVNYSCGIISMRIIEPSVKLLTQIIKADYHVTIIEQHWKTKKEYAFVCIPMHKVESFSITDEQHLNIQ